MTLVDGHLATISELPLARSDRWEPTRAGLLGVWRYWDETFIFHRGRLLLRGPNGSGKSMALELLLPFLLDANAAPDRLTSAAKSRGGLYERLMTGTDDPTRAGFAWVELRRGAEVFTAGVRLRASVNTRKVDTDFFTTSQAIGTDLHLLDHRREPLSRKDLVAALGDAGRVHGTREEHRAAVRTALFPDFTPDRFDSVITALLALRKEKLSQNLDLDKLSAVLTEALPPIDEHDLAVVAEGFERLDRRRAELATLEKELAEVRSLASRQRAYARAVLAAVSGAVRSAESERDKITRAERLAREALEVADREADDVGAELGAVESRDREFDSTITALRSSPAYQEGGQLADLRAESERAKGTAAKARADEERADGAVGEAADEHRSAVEAESVAGENLERAASELRQAATRVGADAVLEEAAAIDPDEAERLLGAWVGGRRQLVDEVRAALDEYCDAIRARDNETERVARDEAVVDERDQAQRASAAALEGALDVHGSAVDRWAAGCSVAGPERVTAAVDAAAGDDPRRHPVAVQRAVDALTAAFAAEHAVARQSLEARRDALDGELATLEAERETVAAGGLVDPPAPVWRADRTGRAGAPLWRVVDPRSGGAVDGLEAALHASGLLDAWLAPHGSVDLGAGTPDVLLTARPVTGPTLADHLVPLADTGVAEGVISEVLASIAVFPSTMTEDAGGPEVAIGLDGTFRLGAAHGQGRVAEATLLGAAARERHRLRRLAELDAALDTVRSAIAAVQLDGEVLDRRILAVAADLAAAPAPTAVFVAERALADAVARLDEASSRLAASRGALRAAEDAVRDVLRALHARAAMHGLPSARSELDAVDGALGEVGNLTSVWARRRRELDDRRSRIEVAARGVRRADEAAQRARDAGTAAAEAASDLALRVATLESTVGVEYAEVVEQIDAAVGEQRAGRDRAKALRQRQVEVEKLLARTEVEVEAAERNRVDADRVRADAHRRFVGVVGDGLADDAGVEVPAPLDGVTAVLEAARAASATVGDSDDRSVERTSSRVDEALHLARAALGGRVDLHRELGGDGWWLLRASTGGIRRRVVEQADRLADELAAGREELAADEEQLFEQVLAGSIRRALAERIRLANQLVQAINNQLGQVKTRAAGVEVRLRWEVEPDQLDAVKAARGLLLRDPADLTADEAASLQAFVRARVEQARIELEANAPWEARLRETLDYRAWHRFALLVGHRDWDGMRPATPRLLQRLSTGERSIALHLPMLASIAAHYADPAGNPSGCPRLILLDELFAGVDTANRAQLFGTFTAWDLDAVFTSDHEWCQYATLDGIAIHHLHPPIDDEPVTSTRFRWDGVERTIDPLEA